MTAYGPQLKTQGFWQEEEEQEVEEEEEQIKSNTLSAVTVLFWAIICEILTKNKKSYSW